MDSATGLAGLLVSGFLSATLLPGNSEFALGALLLHDPTLHWRAIGVATTGNRLGGMTSYAIGRFVPNPHKNRATDWLARYGAPALLLSWVPIFGDALCVASGWMRQNVFAALLFIALGKFARYVVVAEGVSFLTTWRCSTGQRWF